MKKMFLLTSLLFLICACWSKPPAPNSKVVPVSTVKIERRDIPIYFESLGTLLASHIVEVKPQINGTLKEVYFDEGQMVKQGDPLFLIDPIPSLIKIQEAQAILAQDTTLLNTAIKRLERYKALPNPEVISQMQWDELHAQVAIKNAIVKGDKAKLAAANLEIDRCRIKSPIDGRAGKLTIHQGNLVGANQSAPLVTISKIDPLSVEFTLTEKEVSRIDEKVFPLEICLLCDSNIRAKGELIYLENEIDPHSGMLRAKGELPNPNVAFWPGQSVKVVMQVAVCKNAWLVPFKAVRHNEKGSYVYTISEDETADMRPVVVGEEQGGYVVIQEGLNEEDLVVTEGHLRLTPGAKVRLVVEKEPEAQ